MIRLRTFAAVAIASLLGGCASLPPMDGRTASHASTDTAATLLGRAVEPRVVANPDKTGIHALPEPYDAFAARVLLARAAEKSIDAQYYIWHADQVGYLLLESLWRAAERGVRVRLLLDDLNTGGLDPVLAVLDAHPNFEVRLYNPLVQRRLRALNFLSDFTRVNRRMHNKSFTVDNEASVVGGRNIANEYFGAAAGVGFADLDVIAVGPAVREVSKEFDLYWNSASAYPAAQFVGTPGASAAADLAALFTATRADPESVGYLDQVRLTPLIQHLLNGKLAFEWTTATVVHDDPAKTLDAKQRTDVLLFPALVSALGRPQTNLDLISPYFVPGADGTASLVALAQRGITIRVLTNSLAATDTSVVHAGYAKRRQALLEAGIHLYEIKPAAAQDSDENTSQFGESASAALHAKTFAVDRARIFVGSFNFDQRSALLNTEMGLVIESPLLAQQLSGFFDTEVPMLAYEVRLTPDRSHLEWIERTAAGEKHYDIEPGTSWLLRSRVDFMSILPIEWLL
jgi:putative cardiolipin synthase